MKVSLIFILFVVFIAGCIQTGNVNLSEVERRAAEIQCKQECQIAKSNGQDLSNGPCLANSLQNTTDWVCDVAHDPRLDVDNNIENQCSAYRSGIAKHFVEINENCEIIRTS